MICTKTVTLFTRYWHWLCLISFFVFLFTYAMQSIKNYMRSMRLTYSELLTISESGIFVRYLKRLDTMWKRYVDSEGKSFF